MHHAEVVAHRVGDPFGSLVLAVAVTVIEVALIVTLMVSGGKDTSTLARDTVFAAVMISLNGIVGLSLLRRRAPAPPGGVQPRGHRAALATVITLAALCLVLPTFTDRAARARSSPARSWRSPPWRRSRSTLLFVVTQTVRHRDFFLPVERRRRARWTSSTPTRRPRRPRCSASDCCWSSLVAVVGLAKVESPAIEKAVADLGLPQAFVGVVIALLVLLPEAIAAARAARRTGPRCR